MRHRKFLIGAIGGLALLLLGVPKKALASTIPYPFYEVTFTYSWSAESLVPGDFQTTLGGPYSSASGSGSWSGGGTFTPGAPAQFDTSAFSFAFYSAGGAGLSIEPFINNIIFQAAFNFTPGPPYSNNGAGSYVFYGSPIHPSEIDFSGSVGGHCNSCSYYSSPTTGYIDGAASWDVNLSGTAIAVTPEPSAAILFGLGIFLVALWFLGKKTRGAKD